jgi:hypothetical protein
VSTCLRCGKHRSLSGRCGCNAVRRGWGKTAKGQTASTRGVTVVNRANIGRKFCPKCGCHLNAGACRSAVCDYGK